MLYLSLPISTLNATVTTSAHTDEDENSITNRKNNDSLSLFIRIHFFVLGFKGNIIHYFYKGHKMKNVEPHFLLVPQYVGSRIALSIETSNARKPHERYIYTNPHFMRELDTLHLKGHPPLLCF